MSTQKTEWGRAARHGAYTMCQHCFVHSEKLRWFHDLMETQPKHILVCERCASKLDDRWHGCTCRYDD